VYTGMLAIGLRRGVFIYGFVLVHAALLNPSTGYELSVLYFESIASREQISIAW